MNYYLPLTDKVVDADSLFLKDTSFAVPIGIPRGTGPNQSISSGIQHAWDNTSISLFKTCPRKYYFTIQEGWTHRSMPPPLAFGIHLHTCLQTWHQLLAHGRSKDVSLGRIVKLAGLLGEILPVGDTARTKETLIRTIVWYLEQFWEDTTETVILESGKPAVEYSFQLPLGTHKGQEIIVCGHIDRIVHWQGKTYIADYKTTKYTLDHKYFNKYKPSSQFALYCAACKLIAGETASLPAANGVIVDAMQLGVNFTRYARNIIEFSPNEIDEYLTGLWYWITTAMDACEAEYFPANEESCSNYGGCTFRDICSLPKARREDYLKNSFVKTTWDPLQNR